VLQGELSTPIEQSDLTPEHRFAKLKMIYGAAFRTLEEAWKPLKTGGRPLNVRTIAPATLAEQPSPSLDDILDDLAHSLGNKKDPAELNLSAQHLVELERLRIIVRHLAKSPSGNLFRACPPEDRASCAHCTNLEQRYPGRLRFSDFLHRHFDGQLPNMTYDEENKRYLSAFELVERGQLGLVPVDFLSEWQSCELCRCFNFRTQKDLWRHLHLMHPDRSLEQLAATPWTCYFHLPRPLSADGLPMGPPIECGYRSSSVVEHNQHKASAGHKRVRKPRQPAALAEAARGRGLGAHRGRGTNRGRRGRGTTRGRGRGQARGQSAPTRGAAISISVARGQPASSEEEALDGGLSRSDSDDPAPVRRAVGTRRRQPSRRYDSDDDGSDAESSSSSGSESENELETAFSGLGVLSELVEQLDGVRATLVRTGNATRAKKDLAYLLLEYNYVRSDSIVAAWRVDLEEAAGNVELLTNFIEDVLVIINDRTKVRQLRV